MESRERIVCDPDILMGKPTIRGTRISVELVLGWLGAGRSIDQILEAYPQVNREDLLAALNYACEYMKEERIIKMPQAA